MGFPNAATMTALISKENMLLEEIRLKSEVTSTTIVTRIQALWQAADGDFAPDMLDGVESVRSGYASLMSQAAGAAILLPSLRDYARVLLFPDTDPDGIFSRLYDYMIANSQTVKSRNITFGAVTAGGSNVGTGTINRLTVEENALKIEATNVEVKTFKCITDQNSETNPGEERFEVRGIEASKDGMETLGSGLVGELTAISAATSEQLLDNCSFETYDAAATPRFTSWTLTSGTTPTQDTSNYYRIMPGRTTGDSLIFSANALLTQKLSVRQSKLKPGVPYYLQVAYNRQVGAFTGDLKITLGAATVTVSLAAQTGWNILRIALGTGNWYKTFNAADIGVTIQVLNFSAGTLLVDDLIFAPMAQVDGLWYAIVGGATDFLRADTFTFTDTGGTSAINQYWFWRIFGRVLPHDAAAGTATWADPT